MIRVLFVCLGNICRSPMAEAVFQHKVREAGLEDKITSDSAGTGDWHVGQPPHAGTRRILAKNAITYQHQARQIRSHDLDAFDYVLTMDDANHRDVKTMRLGKAQIRPFLAYAPQSEFHEVPDPYYTGNFEEVYQLVSDASDGLLQQIRQDHHL